MPVDVPVPVREHCRQQPAGAMSVRGGQLVRRRVDGLLERVRCWMDEKDAAWTLPRVGVFVLRMIGCGGRQSSKTKFPVQRNFFAIPYAAALSPTLQSLSRSFLDVSDRLPSCSGERAGLGTALSHGIVGAHSLVRCGEACRASDPAWLVDVVSSGMPKWKDWNVTEKLMAAIIASSNGQLDYAEIAGYYGEGTTYSSIENRLRGPRRTANELRIAAGQKPLKRNGRCRASADAVPAGDGNGAGAGAGRGCRRRKIGNDRAVAVGSTGGVSCDAALSTRSTEAVGPRATERQAEDAPERHEGLLPRGDRCGETKSAAHISILSLTNPVPDVEPRCGEERRRTETAT